MDVSLFTGIIPGKSRERVCRRLREYRCNCARRIFLPFPFAQVTCPSSYVKGCGIHRTFNRATNLHGVHNTVVEDTVIYNVMGGAFFLEGRHRNGKHLQGNFFYPFCGLKTASSLAQRDGTFLCTPLQQKDKTNTHVFLSSVQQYTLLLGCILQKLPIAKVVAKSNLIFNWAVLKTSIKVEILPLTYAVYHCK